MSMSEPLFGSCEGAPIAHSLVVFVIHSVATAFLKSESAGVGSNSVYKYVQSGKSHVSILLVGKTTQKYTYACF